MPMKIEGDRRMWQRIVSILCLYVIVLAGSIVYITIRDTGKPKSTGVAPVDGWDWRHLDRDRAMHEHIVSPTDNDTWCWKGRCGVLGVEEEH